VKPEEYDSVKKWFGKRHYAPTTKEGYKDHMDTFCYILKTTPDKLASLSSAKALKAQQRIATVMSEKLHLRAHSIIFRLNALHSFWRANNVPLTKAIMDYDGNPELRR